MSSCRLLVDFHTSTVGTPGEQGEIDMLSGVDVFLVGPDFASLALTGQGEC